MKNLAKDAFFRCRPICFILILQLILVSSNILNQPNCSINIELLQAIRANFITKANQDLRFEICVWTDCITTDEGKHKVQLKSIEIIKDTKRVIAAFVPTKREHHGFLMAQNVNVKSIKQIYVFI